ncbi:MAG: hypothetical protein ACOY82_04590 [Pseudomonadota bacterium]
MSHRGSEPVDAQSGRFFGLMPDCVAAHGVTNWLAHRIRSTIDTCNNRLVKTLL